MDQMLRTTNIFHTRQHCDTLETRTVSRLFYSVFARVEVLLEIIFFSVNVGGYSFSLLQLGAHNRKKYCTEQIINYQYIEVIRHSDHTFKIHSIYALSTKKYRCFYLSTSTKVFL
jgi:hypothetical protein